MMRYKNNPRDEQTRMPLQQLRHRLPVGRYCVLIAIAWPTTEYDQFVSELRPKNGSRENNDSIISLIIARTHVLGNAMSRELTASVEPFAILNVRH